MNSNINITEIIKSTINVEYQTLLGLLDMDFTILETAVKQIYNCKGKIVVSGIGKSAIVAKKMVATLNSTGTKAIFLHTADALHGDLGILHEEDILLIISKSGESRELKEILPSVRDIGCFVIGMESNPNCFLAKASDLDLYVPVSQEADEDDLAPTSSAIAHIAVGDAISMSLKKMKGFSEAKFAKLHPGGLLGKRLNLKVRELSKRNMIPKVYEFDKLPRIIDEVSSKRLGATCVINENNEIVGIVTDGDIRRLIQRGGNIYEEVATGMMSTNPKTIKEDALAITALEMMKEQSITQLIVVNTIGAYCGIVHIHDIIKEGLN